MNMMEQTVEANAGLDPSATLHAEIVPTLGWRMRWPRCWFTQSSLLSEFEHSKSGSLQMSLEIRRNSWPKNRGKSMPFWIPWRRSTGNWLRWDVLSSVWDRDSCSSCTSFSARLSSRAVSTCSEKAWTNTEKMFHFQNEFLTQTAQTLPCAKVKILREQPNASAAFVDLRDIFVMGRFPEPLALHSSILM